MRDGDKWKVGTWKLTGSQGQKGIRLGRRLRDAIAELKPDLVVFEDLRFIPRKRTGLAALSLRWGLQMVLKVVCEQTGTRYFGVDSGEIKQYAVGKRTAQKSIVTAAARRETGVRHMNGDEADAWWLAAYVSKEGVAA